MKNKKNESPNSETLLDFLSGQTWGQEGTRIAIVDMEGGEILAALDSVAQAGGKSIQDVSSTPVLAEDTLAVARMQSSDLSKAIQSCVLPTAAGSPVDILRAQDNIQTLRRVGLHIPSALIIDLDETETSTELNIVNQFLTIRRIKDLDLRRVMIIINGRHDILPEAILESSEVLSMPAQEYERHSPPGPRP